MERTPEFYQTAAKWMINHIIPRWRILGYAPMTPDQLGDAVELVLSGQVLTHNIKPLLAALEKNNTDTEGYKELAIMFYGSVK